MPSPLVKASSCSTSRMIWNDTCNQTGIVCTFQQHFQPSPFTAALVSSRLINNECRVWQVLHRARKLNMLTMSICPVIQTLTCHLFLQTIDPGSKNYRIFAAACLAYNAMHSPAELTILIFPHISSDPYMSIRGRMTMSTSAINYAAGSRVSATQ